jgi:HPt (histidine-containing phosphotransfer) domain-containing protein
MAALTIAIEAGDSQGLFDAAHGLKGSIQFIHFRDFSGQITELEKMGKHEQMEGARELFQSAQDTWTIIEGQLRAFVEKKD